MNKGDFWILNSAIEMTYPLSVLVDKNIEDHFNRRGHGLSRSELVDSLCHLLRNGNLKCQSLRYDDREGYISADDCFPPTHQEVERRLSNEIESYYELTDKGGTHWEAYAQPDWNRFVFISYGLSDDIKLEHDVTKTYGAQVKSAQVLSMNIPLIEQYVTRHVAFRGATVIAQSWDVIAPWQATYWKTLPNAHRKSFYYIPNKRIVPLSKQHIADNRRDWVDLTGWYNHQFD